MSSGTEGRASKGVEQSPLLSNTAMEDEPRANSRITAITTDRTAQFSSQIDQSSTTSSSSTHQHGAIGFANRMTASSEGQQGQRTGLYPHPQGQHVQFDMHSPPSSQPGGQFGGPNSTETHDNDTFEGSEDTPANAGGPTVSCRVCEAEIPLEGKTSQHVVRCQQCNEVTPIRAAPPGKKYVRCPCNCLLVCKATSTRIACPRQNCRRVITLANGAPNGGGIPGTAIRAPVGTCRVQCAYCQEVFMFNTLTNQLAICPHCRKSSSVGARYARSRSLLYFLALTLVAILLIGVIVAIARGQNNFFMLVFLAALMALSLFLTYRFVFFWRIRVSQILGPL